MNSFCDVIAIKILLWKPKNINFYIVSFYLGVCVGAEGIEELDVVKEKHEI